MRILHVGPTEKIKNVYFYEVYVDNLNGISIEYRDNNPSVPQGTDKTSRC